MKEWFKPNSPVDNEDLERHDKWLCMMYPRLQLLKELLSDDGVIFVSIDDNEQHRLRMIMDEIFGENNFVESFIWKKKGGASNTETLIGDIFEYVLMYARNILEIKTNRRFIESTVYRHRDEQGNYKLDPIIKTDEGMYKRDTMKYSIPVPETDENALPPEGKRWTIGYEKMIELLSCDLLQFDRIDGGWNVRKKSYFNENDPQTGVYLNLLLEHGSLKRAKSELVALGFSREKFTTPKPTILIQKLLSIITDSDSIILDSFAGSGTTAHAVLALNKEDGGKRKFILIECEDYADEITAERVRRVIKGVPDAEDKELKEGLGGSFTYCTLGDPIEIEEMLTGNVLPSYTTLANYLLYTASGMSVSENELKEKNSDGLFYQDGNTDYYLLYKPNIEYLRGNEGILNDERAKRIKDVKDDRKALVFGVGKYISPRDLTEMGITFCQLPYELHRVK